MTLISFTMKPQQSIREAYVEASSFFRQHDVMEPESNAKLLLEWVLGLSGASYYMALPDPFPMEHQAAWEEAVQRKVAGEPAQYIIGEQEFYGEVFKVTPAVLIPRPETELLVEAVVELSSQLGSPHSDTNEAQTSSIVEQDQLFHGERLPHRSESASMSDAVHSIEEAAQTADGSGRVEHSAPRYVCVDIGTGSGAIALTLARLCPQWEIWASDISPDALQIAQQNSERQGLSIGWKQGNLLEPFAGCAVDIVVSNPPYIPDADIAELQPEVREHEPLTALAGGPDGLGPYRIMMSQLSLLARQPRMVAFELGMGQAQDVAQMVRETGYPKIHIIKDLAGIERHVIGMLES
ncbi:release factor glutamine methyltransferase [Paenibacillus hunanensis]|uniref:Release factor glutamine methyltransferase n=2 Tax=Paenibacillus hunanensis TaxID=539262 RepID=A0ABU1IVG2_9BACL|nr:release factor glutamine methyltransferase [Paenibacillus hunanensis]GGJ01704.1 release factor glutamine methyltransferase [Paenibacillus hunanensis]